MGDVGFVGRGHRVGRVGDVGFVGRGHRVGRARRVRRVLAGLACVGGLVVAPAADGLADEVVEPPLVVDAGVSDGQVRMTPATQAVSGDHVQWLLANGGADPLTFAVALHAVDASGTGVDIGAPTSPGAGLEPIRLAPGEVARIRLTLDPGPPRALALVARTEGAEPPTTVSGMALVGGGSAVVARVAGSDPAAGTFTLRLDAAGPALVDVALRATAWPGLVRTEEVVEGVLVPAGGRDLEVGLGGAVAGRVRIDVAVGGPETSRTQASVWWWPRPVLAVLAGAMILLTAAAVVVRRARLRRRG